MKKSDKAKLSDAMTQWLQLKELTGSQELQMDDLKKQMVAIADKYPDEFADGVLTVAGVGCLKVMNNPPKFVFADGRALNEVETVGLAKELGAMFAKTGLDIPLIRSGIKRGDKTVLAVLEKHGLTLVQETRLDVKPLKEKAV